jgi:transposase-like protein
MPDKALASWRKCRAVELALHGRSYDQIAREIGYANRGTVHRVVANALADRLVDGIDELREWEAARLDALQAAAWDKAMAGDVRAVNSVLKIIDRRCRLFGLYGHGPAATPPLRAW